MSSEKIDVDSIVAFKEFCGQSHLPILNGLAIAIADELLSLRTAAAPGMEEKMFPLQTSKQSPSGPLQIPWSVAEVAYGAYVRMYGRSQSLEGLAQRGGFSWYEMDQFHPGWRKDASEIESLHQRLREAQAEIEQNDGRINRLNQTCNELHDTIRERESQIATLTAERDDLKSGNDFLRQEIEDWKEANRRAEAERDEARKEVERLRMAVGCATTIKGDMVMRADDPLGMMQEVCAYVKSLRSCPEMGEVDAIEDWLEGKEIEFGVVRRIKRLVEMVGRLSAALTEERKRGDEVAGLLRWWVEFKDGFGQLEGISVGSAVNEWKENARRILAICGKGVGT